MTAQTRAAPQDCFSCKSENTMFETTPGNYRCSHCGHRFSMNRRIQKCYNCGGEYVPEVYVTVGNTKVQTGRWGCRNPKCHSYWPKVVERLMADENNVALHLNCEKARETQPGGIITTEGWVRKDRP